MLKKNQKHELKKHVATIHSHNKLSLIQRKIANALLYNAYPELHDKNEHQISIRELCLLTGYDSHDYKTIKKALLALLATVVEWNLVDGEKLDGSDIWNASSMIADARIQGSICTYSYSNRMRELLFNPLVYGRLNMLAQAKFKSSYGLALYENCVRYQNLSQTPWFQLDLFRKLMGVEQGKYSIFRDFKKRVIDIAVREVNQLSSIEVTLECQKELRQVVAVRFLIARSQNEIKNLDIHSSNPLADQLRQEFGFSPQAIAQTLETYEEKYILEKIFAIKNSANFKKGKIINLTKYLESSLKTIEEKKAAIPIPSPAVQTTMSIVNPDKASLEEVLDHLDKMDEKAKRNFMKKFEEFIEGTLYITIYKRDGLNNILIKDQLQVFYNRMFQ